MPRWQSRVHLTTRLWYQPAVIPRTYRTSIAPCVEGCPVRKVVLAGLIEEWEPRAALERALAHTDPPAAPTQALDPLPSEDAEIIQSLTTSSIPSNGSNSDPEGRKRQTCDRHCCEPRGDADTIGAIAGGVVGGRFRVDTLPDGWLNTPQRRHELDQLAEDLATGSFDRA